MTIITIEINENKLPYLVQTLDMLNAEIVGKIKPKLTASEKKFLKELKQEFIKIKSGKVKTRPIEEFLAELEKEKKQKKRGRR
jgi:hypothetical protein